MSEHASDIPPRYSKSIPPEQKGHVSGEFRIDLSRSGSIATTHKHLGGMHGAVRREWRYGGMLLKSFPAWKMIPAHIANDDTEQRNELLEFIAGPVVGEDECHNSEYGDIPSIDAIAIQIGRIVLEEVEEWNLLSPEIQVGIEGRIIGYINQQHSEFDVIYEIDKPPESLEERLRGISSRVTPEKRAEIIEQARQKVLRRINEEVKKLATEFKEESDANFPDTGLVELENYIKTLAERAKRTIFPTTEDQTQIPQERKTDPATPFARKEVLLSSVVAMSSWKGNDNEDEPK